MTDISKNDIVQIDPESDHMFGGCLMIVDEVKPWGVKCHMTIPGKGSAHYRCENLKFERVGTLAWIEQEP